MDKQTLQFIANGMLGLHVQIGQYDQALAAAGARIAELEAANRLLTQEKRDLKKALKTASKA